MGKKLCLCTSPKLSSSKVLSKKDAKKLCEISSRFLKRMKKRFARCEKCSALATTIENLVANSILNLKNW